MSSLNTARQPDAAATGPVCAAGIDGFEDVSARDPQRGINLALFHPGALAGSGPVWQQAWLCDTRAEGVAFYSREYGAACRFPQALFEVESMLPTPAV
ncbi:hypothetical protein TspCOW1_24900 [Thiohalobacter sp. COW1]|uniref:Uncharacterized protein n=1 Tax=Thiohalobacter thiocyanaticus TaxID=585455 RepID=A0A1Z4VMD7_9GAMM|nr:MULTISPECIES: hypothetical protein [Thiohalobacter]BAZ92655.1 uncharacterized protein FOKN1_0251 [Thiohalobacter thiocyanaticus]BCO32387.1 hypothetical protein TspCOW1_24900 [Thiohalobacter sp. COW1]